MQATNMENESGHRSENHYVILDNKDNLYLQSYGEIVAIRHDNTIYVKESGLERSKTTTKYINLFVERYSRGNIVYGVDDTIFESMEESL